MSDGHLADVLGYFALRLRCVAERRFPCSRAPVSLLAAMLARRREVLSRGSKSLESLLCTSSRGVNVLTAR